MINNDGELQVTLERIGRFQRQIEHLRRVESNPANYMNLDVREYLSRHPSEAAAAV